MRVQDRGQIPKLVPPYNGSVDSGLPVDYTEDRTAQYSNFDRSPIMWAHYSKVKIPDSAVLTFSSTIFLLLIGTKAIHRKSWPWQDKILQHFPS